MSRMFKHRPSPAMVVALVALVVAMSGTAVAGSRLLEGDALIKRNSLSGNRLRAHAITAREIDVRRLGKVATAGRADSAASAGVASSAADSGALGGVPAAGYSRVIYAHVLANGTVDVSQSKGLSNSNVALRAISAYCFTNLPFTPRGGSATIDYGDAGAGNSEVAELQLSSTGTSIDCRAGEAVEVSTSSKAGTFHAEPFYVVLYG
jgi:hypothetical protein